MHVAREAAGDDILLMLDVNCSWAPDEALDIALQCIPYNLYWLEEPIWPPEDFEALAHLGQASETPIATGENACTVYQFQHMMETGCASFVQPSVTKVGGITEWRKVAALAEARNLQVAAHSPYFGPGLLATAHLVAAARARPVAGSPLRPAGSQRVHRGAAGRQRHVRDPARPGAGTGDRFGGACRATGWRERGPETRGKRLPAGVVAGTNSAPGYPCQPESLRPFRV